MLGDGCAGCCRSLPPVQSEPSWDQAAWFIDTLGSGNIGNIPAYQPGNQTIRFNVSCNVFCIISYLNIKRESNRYNWVLFGLGSESCKLVDLFTILIISLDPLFWFSFVAFIRNIGENSETRCKWVKGYFRNIIENRMDSGWKGPETPLYFSVLKQGGRLHLTGYSEVGMMGVIRYRMVRTPWYHWTLAPPCWVRDRLAGGSRARPNVITSHTSLQQENIWIQTRKYFLHFTLSTTSIVARKAGQWQC